MSMTEKGSSADALSADDELLVALGYEKKFDRKMNLWANFALGFLYLSPLVGVIALFGLGLSSAGPPAIWWIVIAGVGQLLVALVFAEIVSQYPLAGGVYQWARRLWTGGYAWFLSWIYTWALIIGITTTALFSTDFIASLFTGNGSTPLTQLLLATAVTVIGLLLNTTGTRTLSRISNVGLAAELSGVIVVGLYLLIFSRRQPFSVFFDAMGAGAGGYVTAFIGASLVGLLLFAGFEACGEVAEEVPDAARRIPRSMQLTVVVGGAAAFFAFAGYVLAAPDLPEIISGQDANPIPHILEASVGTVGTKVFLVVALTSFLACVMGQQAAVSRVVYAFSRDDMFPGAKWLGRIAAKRHVPVNALIATSVVPVLLYVFVFFFPDSLFRIAGFQALAVYVSFQMVVVAALRARSRGWRPAGVWSLGRAGLPVAIGGLVYGVTAIVLLALPTGAADAPFLDRWIGLIGFLIVAGIGLAYLLAFKPQNKSRAPQGDAVEIAQLLTRLRTRTD